MTVSENTVSDLLSEYLRARGLDAMREITARVPKGIKKPDFELLIEGKKYYGEAEWNRTFSTVGMTQAINYGDIPGASGYFAIGYPEELKDRVGQAGTATARLEAVKAADVRFFFKVEGKPASPKEYQVSDLPGAVNSIIAEGMEAPSQAHFTGFIQDAVTELASFLPRGRGTPRLFENVLAMVPEGREQEETARRAAAYLLLDQIIFYRILSAGGAYLSIDPRRIRAPSYLQEYFDAVLRVDYQAIFSIRVAALFPPRAGKFLSDVVRLVADIEPEQFGRDLLGSIFHNLIPREVRKPVAAYYTHPWAARLLARLAGIGDGQAVLDLACGSGTLLVAAYEQKETTDSRPGGQARHAAYLGTELTGIDIMPFAAHLAAVQLALQHPQQLTRRVRIGLEDSTTLRPGAVIDPLARRATPQRTLRQYGENPEPVSRTQRGSVSPQGAGRSFRLQQVDAVLMNPPFTRKQFIDTSYREELGRRLSDYGDYLSNEMGYYGYFVLLADRFLGVGGRMGLVLPSAVLRQESTLGVRRFLREHYTIEQIVAAGWRSAFSDSSSLREILLVVRKGKTQNDTDATASFLKTAPREGNIDMLVSQILDRRSTDDIDVRRIQQSAFEGDDWLPLVPGLSYEHIDLPVPRTAKMTTFSRLKGAKLIQGLRMERSSSYMNPSDSLLSFKREARTRVNWEIVSSIKGVFEVKSGNLPPVKIPHSAVLPSCRSLSGIDRLLLSESPDFVVVQRFAGDRSFWSTKDPGAMLVRRREHVRSRTGRLVVAGYGNIDLAAPGTSFLAVFAGPPVAPTWTCWVADVSVDDDAKILTLYWNSTFNIAYLLRNRNDIRGTVVKWRKEVLEDIPVLDPEALDPSTRKGLLASFDRLSRESFPSLYEQFRKAHALRLELDLAVGQALGESASTLRPRLLDIYVEIADLLDELKQTMGED